MNHVVLLGNGFDLAHGLKTSYKDFLLWYLKKIAESVEQNHFYEDDVIKITFNEGNDFGSVYISHRKPEIKKGSLSNSPESLLDLLKFHNYVVEKKSILITELISHITDSKWVDIESLYYSIIIRIYKRMIKEKSNTTNQDLINLNKSFHQIKTELREYLISLDIDSHFQPYEEIIEHFIKIEKKLNLDINDRILFINFNYTETMKFYLSYLGNNIIINHIHGKLTDSKHPLIFGYGDETDSHYEEIERLDNNEFLKFMKSFGYARTSDLQNVISFINAGEYETYIMGHSCGLSDRVLLKDIFENIYCKKINIFYYEQDQQSNDYTTKYMDISRHFSLDKKSIMRVKIVPFEHSQPLINSKSRF